MRLIIPLCFLKHRVSNAGRCGFCVTCILHVCERKLSRINTPLKHEALYFACAGKRLSWCVCYRHAITTTAACCSTQDSDLKLRRLITWTCVFSRMIINSHHFHDQRNYKRCVFVCAFMGWLLSTLEKKNLASSNPKKLPAGVRIRCHCRIQSNPVQVSCEFSQRGFMDKLARDLIDF